jgi:hypothetical protein
VDWVAVLFQHEVMHTAVLRLLLSGDHRVAVARVLTGDSSITDVADVHPEGRLSGASRPVDLATVLVLGQRDGRMGVEVKVDSAWNADQLRAEVPKDCHGVLLALGYTALAVTDEDVAALDDYAVPWRLVRPARWGQIVRECANGDGELLRYAQQLEEEADDQQRALRAVAAGESVTWGRHHQSLEHWAYFHEVVRWRDDAAKWQRSALVSGPLLTRFLPPFGRPRGDYLELMGEGSRRSLCVKTYAPPGTGELPTAKERLSELLRDLPSAPVRRPRANAKTCTAVRFPLDDRLPEQAAQLVGDLQDRLARREP